MQMYRTFNPGNYESFDDIETIDDDFIHLAYGDATNKLRPSLIGTSKNKTVLKILSYSIQEDKFNTQKYEQENEIVHIIACDFLNKGKSLSYILICNDKTERENDGNNDENNDETENTEENKKYKVFCFTPGEEVPNIEIGECDKMPILYSKGDWSNFLILQNGSTTTIYNYKDKLKSEKVTGFPNLAKDHSSGFIDIDGDLKSELVLVTEKNDKRYITIIDEYNKDFKIRQSINIPNETGPIGFGDFNASGAFDIVFISKEGNSHYLNILLNKRPAIENRERRGSEYLKYTDHSKYTDDPFSMTEDKYYHKVSLDIFDGLKPMMKACDKMLNGLPTGLLVADITINSYPDLILLMKDSNDKVHIRILENKFDGIDDNQTFVPLKIYPPDMNDILSVSIADVKKKGRDCLVVNRIHNGEYSIGNVESNISKDSYKIHVTTLRPGTRRGAYQGSVPGVSYKYKIDEDEIVRIGSQMNQFSHLSFQTPTAFLGLGSTNFFIDKFFLSGPSRTHFDKIYVLGSKVLPNSEIVLLPTEKGVITELYLSFGKNVINIVIVFSIVLLLNFILVIYTYKKEKDLEKKAKKRESYLFNFSAL